MSVINTGSFAKLLWPGLNAIWGKEYPTYQSHWKQLVDEYKSEKNFEEDLGVVSTGLAQVKTQGGPITYDTEKQGYLTRYQHLVYGLGIVITREMYEDDQYGYIGQRKVKALSASMNQTKDIVVANMYNSAFDTNVKGGDGVNLLSASHPNVTGGTWSNRIGVDADLSEAALEQAVIDIARFTNDRGLRIALTPKKLIIPVESQFEAHRILKSVNRVGTSNNDDNALRTLGIIPDVFSTPYISAGSGVWFLRTSATDGLKLFQRRAAEFTNDNDFGTENALFKATERYSVGWTDPRALYGSAGA